VRDLRAGASGLSGKATGKFVGVLGSLESTGAGVTAVALEVRMGAGVGTDLGTPVVAVPKTEEGDSGRGLVGKGTKANLRCGVKAESGAKGDRTSVSKERLVGRERARVSLPAHEARANDMAFRLKTLISAVV